ncbi:DNA polymerase (family 10) [Limimonas halophila]|uniref:DNA polymerase beta n=1 Tax=Limimonas halophila TaxID=1082479 RepID=A0A1G7L2H2_9PROT|nr:DNA polymerase/3'-5' exonuclease PolX [Limimonas halophila]SDF43653.1 DNA polymerase (family 10) [Limimonas halophila]
MAIHNSDIAEQFDEIADLLEIQGANAFRVRAYRTGARTLRDLPHAVAAMVDNGEDLTELPGIGEDLAAKIREVVVTGELSQLGELEREVPPGLVEVLGIAGLGPKRVQALHRQLGVDNLDDLRTAAEAGQIRTLSGFGAKTEANIRHELATRGSGEKRTRLRQAEEVAEPLAHSLRGVDGVETVTIAGSYRRRKETVGDLDILVTCRADSPVIERFVNHEDVRHVVSKGETRSTVVLRNSLQVDLRVVASAARGAALHYFTGSKAHNIHIRRLGQERGLKINEYGVFQGTERVAGATEAEVYARVGLPEIPPELREDRGEIAAAQAGTLPDLITTDAIRGNLHTHTTASDGHASPRQMAEAAREQGWDYLAISDHSKAVRVANGLDAERLAAQIDEIDALDAELKDITVLKACEVDILEDGRLDLPDAVLARLDLTLGAIHSHMSLAREKQTARVLKAMDNPNVSILAHPTGRKIGTREPCALDMERVIAHAAETGCVLEVNAQPDRLDLNDLHCRMARDAGVRLAIGTDAHAKHHFAFMRDGVDQARRGWVTPADVINTLPLGELRRTLAR